jgi:hypothetical protein
MPVSCAKHFIGFFDIGIPPTGVVGGGHGRGAKVDSLGIG